MPEGAGIARAGTVTMKNLLSFLAGMACMALPLAVVYAVLAATEKDLKRAEDDAHEARQERDEAHRDLRRIAHILAADPGMARTLFEIRDLGVKDD